MPNGMFVRMISSKRREIRPRERKLRLRKICAILWDNCRPRGLFGLWFLREQKKERRTRWIRFSKKSCRISRRGISSLTGAIHCMKKLRGAPNILPDQELSLWPREFPEAPERCARENLRLWRVETKKFLKS